MSSKDEQRIAFQELLDERFPIGALCATFYEQGERLRPTGVEVVTGRVVCTAVKPAEDGGWWHRVIIDPRRNVEEDVEPLDAWIGDLRQHAVVPDLWEARIESRAQRQCLRFQGHPDRPWRPTRAMRAAVTKLHASEIAERSTAASFD